MGLIRRGLSYINENLLKTSEAALVEALWRNFLIYDGLILGPARGGTQLVTAIKERKWPFSSLVTGIPFSMSTSNSGALLRAPPHHHSAHPRRPD